MGLDGKTGVVFDVQRYSIHDGPGIRTIIFLKGCPLHCPWCANPESQRPFSEIWYNKQLCIRCDACIQACPNQCISRGETGPVFDFQACLRCGTCADACCSGAASMIGRTMSVEETLHIIERDRIFYAKSGGGVTLSGGEPLMQSEFSRSLLMACRERGISTAMETCGCAPWEAVARVLPFTGLFLYDLKIFDAEKHKRILGASNEPILSNLRRLIEEGGKAVVRVPLIPGFNDDAENLKNILRYSKEVGAEYVNLLPYHRYGEGKYDKLGRPYSVTGQPQTDEEINALLQQVGDFGIRVVIGG